MNRAVPFLTALAVLLLQMSLSDLLTIRGLRPDFILIYVVYVSLKWGSLTGVIAGFSMGLMEDALSAGSLMGLAPLTKSLTGFLVGRLQGSYNRMSPLAFHGIWLSIVAAHFFIFVYVHYQSVVETSSGLFWLTYLYAMVYSVVFMGVLQVILPFSGIRPPES